MKFVLHGFHVVIWQILIVKIQGDNCPYSFDLQSYYECKTNVLNEYDLTPEGSGANCETFQYYFYGDELVMSTPRTRVPNRV